MIPPGYKQTEVGVIPEEWEVKIVGDLAQIKTGPFGKYSKRVSIREARVCR